MTTTTLPDIRDRVRSDLRDLDTEAARWSDAELDRHISRALADVSLAAPVEATTIVATTPGSRELTTAVLPNFLELESVELPVDAFPRRHVPCSVWGETITLEPPAPPKGERARLRYLARHTLDDDGTTLPEALADVLSTGAAGYAAIAWAAYAIDRLTAGDDVAERFRLWGEGRLHTFRDQLRERERPRRVRSRRPAASG